MLQFSRGELLRVLRRRHQKKTSDNLFLSFRCYTAKQFPAGLLRLPKGCTTIQPVPKNGSCAVPVGGGTVGGYSIPRKTKSAVPHQRSRAVARVHRVFTGKLRLFRCCS